MAPVHPEPVNREMNPPPDRPAKPNDHMPESWQGQSAPGGALWLDPEIGHLADRLTADRLALGNLRPHRRQKKERQEDQPREDQLLEDHGVHGRRLKRPAREP